MKVKDCIALRKIINSKEYNENNFNLNHIFKAFSSFAIKTQEDFAKAPNEFLEFITNNHDCFNFASEQDSDKFISEIPDFIIRLDSFFKAGCALKHDAYTITAMTLAPNKENSSLLEVGAGSVPYSSISIARHIKDVSSIDNFSVSNDCLKTFNVTGIDDMFTEKTDVSPYDFIIAQRSCGAFEDIVKSASSANKPYFLQLCNCELENIAKRTGIHRSWKQILPEYDSNIKFYDNFAFNVDATPQQVRNLLLNSSYTAYKLNCEKLISPEYQKSDNDIIFGESQSLCPPQKPLDNSGGQNEDFEDFLMSIN